MDISSAMIKVIMPESDLSIHLTGIQQETDWQIVWQKIVLSSLKQICPSA